MNRFQDNDHSYDDLLNEYAGDSLPSKPIRENSQTETKKTTSSQPAKSESRPVFTDSLPSYNRYSDESSFDIDLLKNLKSLNAKKLFQMFLKNHREAKANSRLILIMLKPLQSELPTR